MGSQLTSTRTLPIPPLIVPNGPRIRTPCRRITTRTRNRNPTTKFRRRAAKAKLATADIQGAGRDVGPLHAPSRVALALVITLRDTAVAAKIRACAAYTDTCCWVSFWKLLCERNWYFLREHLKRGGGGRRWLTVNHNILLSTLLFLNTMYHRHRHCPADRATRRVV